MHIALGCVLLLSACSSGSALANEGATTNSAGAAKAVPATNNNSAATEAQPAPERLTGTTADQLAQVLRNIARLPSHDWDSVRAAFPGARWGARRSERGQEMSDSLEGSIALAGHRYGIIVGGTRTEVKDIMIQLGLDPDQGEEPGAHGLVAWDDVVPPLRRLGVTVSETGRRCDFMNESRSIGLTAGGNSKRLSYSIGSIGAGPNAGTVTLLYQFDLGSGWSEAITGIQGCDEPGN